MIEALFQKPLLDLVYEAANVHRKFHGSRSIQLNKLVSVKTGGCPEDCAYCPQAARYKTKIEKHRLMSVDDVRTLAVAAKEKGVSRVCLGAAWREVRDGDEFDRVIQMIETIAELGVEVCCTLGMLNHDQAARLKEAGLTAYNHNLDSSEQFYKSIIHTRTYQDRLATIQHVQDVGLSVCCGAIIGMGESVADRITLLNQLARLDPQPESVPINALIPIAGTPLADRPRIDTMDIVRMIAATRITLPHAKIRLSAGRTELSESDHALCFLAGANSMFYDDRLLTAPNPTADHDDLMLKKLGMIRI